MKLLLVLALVWTVRSQNPQKLPVQLSCVNGAANILVLTDEQVNSICGRSRETERLCPANFAKPESCTPCTKETGCREEGTVCCPVTHPKNYSESFCILSTLAPTTTPEPITEAPETPEPTIIPEPQTEAPTTPRPSPAPTESTTTPEPITEEPITPMPTTTKATTPEPTTTRLTTTTPPTTTEEYNKYECFKETMNFEEATNFCRQKRGKLAIIRSAEEQEMVKKALLKNCIGGHKEWAYIGFKLHACPKIATLLLSSKLFKWTDGEGRIFHVNDGSFQDWATGGSRCGPYIIGSPNNCGVVSRDPSKEFSRWSNENCNGRRFFVCEYE